MADLTITSADVLSSSSASPLRATAGASIAAGDVVYIDTADSKIKPADNTSEASSVVAGIAVNSAAAEQPIDYVQADPKGIDVGATLTVGETYVLSGSGNIAPIADLVSTNYVSILGVATAVDSLLLKILNSKTQLA